MSALEIITTVLVSAGGGAAILAGLASWLGKVWAIRLAENEKGRHAQELERLKTALGSLVEAEKARFGAEHKALELILQRRIDTYPQIYEFLSDILKTSDPAPTVSLDLPKAIAEFNRWDSRTSIWMSVDTSNCCYTFRQALLAVGSSTDPGASGSLIRNLRRKAEEFEHALRTDIGLAGMRLSKSESGKDIEPAVERTY